MLIHKYEKLPPKDCFDKLILSFLKNIPIFAMK